MVKVKNRQELLDNALSSTNRKAREIVLDAAESLLDEVDPKKIIMSKLIVSDETLRISEKIFNLASFKRIIVVGGGKASGSMAEALEGILGNRIKQGLVVVPKGTADRHNTKKIILYEGSHPIPNSSSIVGARKIINLVSHVQEDDLVICLISGGGSSLMALPRKGIPLKDKQKVTNLLLKCGATINEMNVVRKHISAFKGGQLAKAAYPATVLGLMLSDVLGDPLDVIASGPTVPDSATFGDAIKILKRHDLWEKVPNSVKKVLSDGEKGLIEENPKKDSSIFEKVFNIVIGNNRLACQAAIKTIKKFGLNTVFLTSFLEGEAREVGTALSALVKEVLTSSNPLPAPAGIIVGGETTVTVTGKGKGGRNQEISLAAALKIDRLDRVVIASISTDGVDGPTDAAGALIDGETLQHSKELGLDAKKYLKDNDSYSFFSRVGGLVYTGPTGTNVNDVMIMVIL